MTLMVLFGVGVILLIVSLLTVIISEYEEFYMENKLNKRPFIFLGKLNDSSSGDDIRDAVKYLKLTNSIK